MNETMTWCMFLKYLSTPNGIAVATGIAWSLLFEYVPLFQTLTTKWKRVAFFVLSILLPLLAAALGVWTCQWTGSWEGTFWPALVAGAMAFASGTMAHTPKLKDLHKEP